MRRFVVSCKDSKTGYEVILSECSYNMACDWLERELAKVGLWVEQARTRNNLVEILTVDKNLLRGRTFFYDESRGYLLGE